MFRNKNRAASWTLIAAGGEDANSRPSRQRGARRAWRRNGNLFLAAAHGARLFVLPAAADDFERAFAVDFFFSRRNARSTGSPFFSLISVIALTSFPGRVTTGHVASSRKIQERGA
jgi:hypothetical protein